MEVDQSRDLSQVRIHIERVIGVLRQKYAIPQAILPIRLFMAHTSEKGTYSIIDKIVYVCSALCNWCESVSEFSIKFLSQNWNNNESTQ